MITILVVSNAKIGPRNLLVATTLMLELVLIVFGSFFKLIVIDNRLQMVLYLDSMEGGRVFVYIRTHFHMLGKLDAATAHFTP